MTAPEPSRPADEHTDAVAFVIESAWSDGDDATIAHAILASTDPAVHAALAASLPAEVMLAALVDRGALTQETEDIIGFHDETCPDPCPFGKRRRFVTPWEAP